MQTKTQIDNEIMKEQNKQFVKPLATIMSLCKFDSVFLLVVNTGYTHTLHLQDLIICKSEIEI